MQWPQGPPPVRGARSTHDVTEAACQEPAKLDMTWNKLVYDKTVEAPG